MLFRQLRSGYLTYCRSFNWKYPFPRDLQPSPPEKEKIDPANLLELGTTLSENEIYNKEFLNRNPRNLEQMLLEVKPNGFMIDKPSVIYWNKLFIEKSSKHTTAKVVHNSGRTILSASTREWAIRKQLYSSIDINAVVNIARVLARRCLESGILFVHHEFSEEEMATMKDVDKIMETAAIRRLIQLFLKNLENEGLKIEEPSAIRLKDRFYL